jgi:peptide/nickel transport system substrate-binding protein
VTVAACGGGGETASESASATPVPGGTLTFATSNLTSTLDPAQLLGGGTVGGIELQTIYDTIVGWNPGTQQYENRTAKSVSHNADYTQWTVTLRSGITFTDGTAYDAAAVKFNVDRQSAKTSRAPSRAILQTFLKDVAVTDAMTVTFNLTQSWASFPYLLSREVGMVPSPAAVQKDGDKFGTIAEDAAGAGPFMVKSYRVGDRLQVVRNPQYYGTKAYLDGIDFVLPSTDPSVVEQGVKTAQFQAAYILDPVAVASAKSDGLMITAIPAATNPIIIMNSASGPTTNPDIRRAVAAAIDPKEVNNRVYSGTLTASSDLFPSSYSADPKVPGPKYDPALARQLVSQAKAAGFNGTIRLAGGNTPVGTNFATTVKAMLDNVGFNTQVTLVPQGNVTAQILVQKDFDLAQWALSIVNDDGAFGQLFLSFSSQAKRYGYSAPDMDASLGQLRTAATTAEKATALAGIAKIINRDAPMLAIGSQDQSIVTTNKVHGIAVTSSQAVLLAGAWISK